MVRIGLPTYLLAEQLFPLLLKIKLLIVRVQANVPLVCTAEELLSVQDGCLLLDLSVIDHEVEAGDLRHLGYSFEFLCACSGESRFFVLFELYISLRVRLQSARRRASSCRNMSVPVLSLLNFQSRSSVDRRWLIFLQTRSNRYL